MTTLRLEVGAVVAPGDRLASLRRVQTGGGTYARGGHIFSCLVGRVSLSDDDETQKVSIESRRPQALSQVLTVGQLVLCRVQRIMLQQVAAEIVAAQYVGRLMHLPEATIRREDIRQNAVDELLLETCFRPGDWVLGRIVSLGDSRRYLVSTAEAELGVVRAYASGIDEQPMMPISWKEMQCPVSGRKEPRKVAKPSQSLVQLFSKEGAVHRK